MENAQINSPETNDFIDKWNFAHPLGADPDNCWQYPNTEQQFVGRKIVIKSNLLFEHFLFAYVIRCSTLHLSR
jgi:hypothetical protein